MYAPNESRSAGPVIHWAVDGGILLLFQFYVLGRWMLGPTFVPTLPGPEPKSSGQQLYFQILQLLVSVAMLICFWVWIVVPWQREGRLTTDCMLALSVAMIFFWDTCMNYTSVALLYNSHLVNYGAWANGVWPGWTSPNGNLLPEPIFVVVPGYTCLVFGQVVFVCWVLRRAKQRWPAMGIGTIIALIVIALTGIDSVLEMALIRSGVYANPGGIRAITVFAGQTYQLPMSEGFLLGGFGLGSIAVLRFFRDDKGQTLAERGIESVQIGVAAKQWLRFLAIFGFCHGMCVSGNHHDQCPGTGVAMPQPTNNPF